MNATIREGDRTLNADWFLGHDDEGGEVFAVLTVSHHGRAEYMGQLDKCYTARLGRETVKTLDGGFKMRQIKIGLAADTVGARFASEATARYSAKKMREYFDAKVAEVEEGRTTRADVAEVFDLSVNEVKGAAA